MFINLFDIKQCYSFAVWLNPLYQQCMTYFKLPYKFPDSTYSNDETTSGDVPKKKKTYSISWQDLINKSKGIQRCT